MAVRFAGAESIIQPNINQLVTYKLTHRLQSTASGYPERGMAVTYLWRECEELTYPVDIGSVVK